MLHGLHDERMCMNRAGVTKVMCCTGLRHQVSYLLGVPVTGYALEIGKEHVSFAEVPAR